MSRLLEGEPTVVTAGVALFEEALTAQAVPVVPVDWRPPLDAPGASAVPPAGGLGAPVGSTPFPTGPRRR